MCNGDSVEFFWENKKIALPGKRLACLGLQRWKPAHAYIRWSSYPYSSYFQGSDQHVNDSVCNGENAELFPNSHINFPIALNLAGGYHEYFNSNVKISQKFLNHQDCIIRIQSFPSCPFTCPHGLPISQVIVCANQVHNLIEWDLFKLGIQFYISFFLFTGIEFCYLCVQQYFKVVSPAFKNTAANAFLLSANLSFEDSWPNSQLPPFLFVLMALWLRILISWFPDCFSSLDYNIRLQET